jgi:type IV pilus assembly protein PilB
MNDKQVAELFVEQRVLEPLQAEDVLTEVELNGKSVAQAIIDGGYVDERGFYQTMAEALGTDYIDLTECEIAPEVLRFVPAGMARLHGALPIDMVGNVLRLALLDPLDPKAAEDLRFALGKDIQVVVSPAEQIEALIKQYYGSETSSMEEVLKQLGEVGELLQVRGDEEAAVEAEANATPIIRFVDLILYQAILDRASDIHFEPFENEFKIRYRVDGALYEMAPPPRHLALPVISRVKVMANMNIAERRLPQDGRIQKHIAGRNIDLRVSTLPTQFGESLVLRVLDRTTVNLDLEALGLPDYIYSFLLELINRPNGIFIATGPTGSGKTTTLYSCLRKINTIDSKLLTVRGTRRIRSGGDRAGASKRSHRPDLCPRPALVFAPRPRSHHGRGDTRLGDGPDRHSSVADRTSRFYYVAYKRRSRCDYTSDRHGHRAVSDFRDAGGGPRAAFVAKHLHAMSHGVSAK